MPSAQNLTTLSEKTCIVKQPYATFGPRALSLRHALNNQPMPHQENMQPFIMNVQQLPPGLSPTDRVDVKAKAPRVNNSTLFV